jgi:predicted metallopeptidase
MEKKPRRQSLSNALRALNLVPEEFEKLSESEKISTVADELVRLERQRAAAFDAAAVVFGKSKGEMVLRVLDGKL